MLDVIEASSPEEVFFIGKALATDAKSKAKVGRHVKNRLLDQLSFCVALLLPRAQSAK